MMGCPHFLQGSVESGGKSPGINTFTSHPGQVTIFKLPLVLIAVRQRLPLVPRRPCRSKFSRVHLFVTPHRSDRSDIGGLHAAGPGAWVPKRSAVSRGSS